MWNYGYSSKTIDGILAGAFDLNVLAGPDAENRLRLDALDTARHAQEAGMGGFLLLSNDFPTMAQAKMLNRVYPGLTVYGALTFNHVLGYFDYEILEAAVYADAVAVLLSEIDYEYRGSPSYFDESGSLNRDAWSLLDMAAGHYVIVFSGGLSHEDAVSAFDRVRGWGVDPMVLSQSPDCVADCEHGARAVALGAYVEHSYAACMPGIARVAPAQLARNIRAAGVESSILTSGFGQWFNPPPAEGLRMAIAAMLAEGIAPEELEILVKRNPARLLGIDE